MLEKLVAIIIILCIITTNISFTSNSSIKDDSYKCQLGSKTPYRCVANYNDTSIKYSGCVEKKIWLILRHGTRYPGKKYIPRMLDELPKLQYLILKNYEEGRTRLSADDIALLKKWRPLLTPNDTMKLAPEGENEMVDLGERYQARFPSLMPEIYSNQTYKFRYTSTQRTEESARHFAAGLFGWRNSQCVWYPEPIYKDPIIRFYKACPRWHQEVDKNPKARAEKKKFLESKFVTDMLDNIKNYIGHSVNYETALLMHTMCAFETAWDQSIVSPWCKMFSLNDFKVFEFAEDLEFYWIDGYGYQLTYEQACPVLKDMFDFLSSKESPTTTVYFTHSGAILKFLALIGVAKDTHPLMHDSFTLHGEDERAWKSSIIDAFASNIAFVLYDCVSQGPSVLFMFQEQPLYLPSCPSDKPCPISIMKDIYPDSDEECLFDVMCHTSTQDN
ncbi:multiple inositol polyphosphate phosphatase 1-like [Odontomachus brunneus]|uniref:multiple inositol polyphosphate phosphatase 1-like n=1 Tax=Odontomachus brunneus TaxID=486640 RepID=UPI0013F274EF|nr:multiple inositol polyphosphate phosphatase 1-like [Odontomachus brunneus]